MRLNPICVAEATSVRDAQIIYALEVNGETILKCVDEGFVQGLRERMEGEKNRTKFKALIRELGFRETIEAITSLRFGTGRH